LARREKSQPGAAGRQGLPAGGTGLLDTRISLSSWAGSMACRFRVIFLSWYGVWTNHCPEPGTPVERRTLGGRTSSSEKRTPQEVPRSSGVARPHVPWPMPRLPQTPNSIHRHRLSRSLGTIPPAAAIVTVVHGETDRCW